MSKQVFDLVFLPPDSGGFVPVYFSRMDCAIHQPYAGDTLALTPAAGSMEFAQPVDFAKSGPCREGLNVSDFAQNLEAHRVIVSPPRDTVNREVTLGGHGSGRDFELWTPDSQVEPAN
jgi:hypothetical protein